LQKSRRTPASLNYHTWLFLVSLRIPDWKFWSSLALVSVALGALISTIVSGASVGRGQGANLQFPASNARNGFTFRDEFNYRSIDQMLAAGWTLCGGAPSSHYSVNSGILTLQNDGITGSAVCWSNIPAGVTSWTSTARGKWVGGNYGSIEQIMQTMGHVYRWDADGYYSQFILLRDDIIVFRENGYTPRLNAWHVLSMNMVQGTISMLFDGTLIGHFNETDPIVSLSTISLIAGWESITSWDSVTVSSH